MIRVFFPGRDHIPGQTLHVFIEARNALSQFIRLLLRQINILKFPHCDSRWSITQSIFLFYSFSIISIRGQFSVRITDSFLSMGQTVFCLYGRHFSFPWGTVFCILSRQLSFFLRTVIRSVREQHVNTIYPMIPLPAALDQLSLFQSCQRIFDRHLTFAHVVGQFPDGTPLKDTLELVHTNASIIVANKIKPAKRMSSLS